MKMCSTGNDLTTNFVGQFNGLVIGTGVKKNNVVGDFPTTHGKGNNSQFDVPANENHPVQTLAHENSPRLKGYETCSVTKPPSTKLRIG